MSSAAVDEIGAVLEGWSDAYRAQDVEALLAMGYGDDVQLVGTGADEVRFGLDEYRVQAERDFSQADEVEMRFTNVHATIVGDAAFAYCDVAVVGTVGGQSFAAPGLRLTVGLVRTDAGWRFVQTHLSAPASGQGEGQSF
ncbi:nuclear transport factor 2 family protein [Agromyces sp. SYSU T00194]|uniref:nuclear transport factor 2 family protein n=1 Tax=Agromyces chitinivorans TaxID=3158560 RepID=UPI003390F7E9